MQIMDERITQSIITLGGMLVLGLYAITIERTSEIATDPITLLIIVVLGMIGAVIKFAWDRTILIVIWAAATGAFIGVLVTSETWFELIFAGFLGIFLVAMGWYTFDRLVSDSSPETAPGN